jgi:hypothetical protein
MEVFIVLVPRACNHVCTLQVQNQLDGDVVMACWRAVVRVLGVDVTVVVLRMLG